MREAKADRKRISSEKEQEGLTVHKFFSVSFSGFVPGSGLPLLLRGGLAQLGERLPCKQEVSGSIPLISTTWVASSAGLSTRLISERSMVRVHCDPPPSTRMEPYLDNCTIQTRKEIRPVAIFNSLEKKRNIGLRISENQAKKSTGRMPMHQAPKKDVASCEKLRGAASRH